MTNPDREQPQAADAPPPAEAAETPIEGAATEGTPAPAEEKKVRWGVGKKDKRQVEDLTRAKEAAEQALAVHQDRLLRLQADFDNFRKRTIREKAELYRTANEELLGELLPVIDHFELALGAVEGSNQTDAFTKGVRMVRDQLLAVLTKFGLQPQDATGQQFDPARHEAISHLPSETVPENGILMQTRRGYQLGDKLLRAAQVVVSSGNAVAVPVAPTESKTGEE